jgi:hypothetical protein
VGGVAAIWSLALITVVLLPCCPLATPRISLLRGGILKQLISTGGRIHEHHHGNLRKARAEEGTPLRVIHSRKNKHKRRVLAAILDR